MAEPNPIFSLANEETARLKWFEAFMRGRCPVPLLPPCVIPTKLVIRVELEQQMYVGGNIVHDHEPVTDCPHRISGLEALLKEAPPLPEHNLLWHCALEELLDGTQNGSNPIMDS
jgi:hypothetical protein